MCVIIEPLAAGCQVFSFLRRKTAGFPAVSAAFPPPDASKSRVRAVAATSKTFIREHLRRLVRRQRQDPRDGGHHLFPGRRHHVVRGLEHRRQDRRQRQPRALRRGHAHRSRSRLHPPPQEEGRAVSPNPRQSPGSTASPAIWPGTFFMQQSAPQSFGTAARAFFRTLRRPRFFQNRRSPRCRCGRRRRGAARRAGPASGPGRSGRYDSGNGSR